MFALTGVFAFGLLMAYAYLAPLESLDARVRIPGSVVVAADGTLLSRDAGEGIRIPVALGDVAPVAIDATIAAEDRRFRSHPGVDPIALARATWRLPAERTGASTITQQLARRLYLDDYHGPLLARKAREMLLAIRLESRYSKDALLEAYLNEVYYGRGAYGIEAAARVYFGVGARELDVSQAAYLAGLPQLPAVYDSASDATPALARQRYVLDRMVATGVLDRATAEHALDRPLVFAVAAGPARAPHAVDYARAELARLRPDLAGLPGLIIETTLDAALQREAERSVQVRLAEITRAGATNAAVVVMEPGSGRLLALVGGGDYDAPSGGQINMALAPRQPGSAMKPFLYAAAFERGYTAATPVLDVPSSFETASGPYAPVNFNLRHHGPVPVRVALASSLNVPAVRVLDDIGVAAFLEIAHRHGSTSLGAAEAYGLALALGGGEVPLLDLTAAYGAIAHRGELARPYLIARVRDAAGRVVYEHAPGPTTRAMSAEHAFLLADILSDPEARLAGFGSRSALETPLRAAVKTGTSSAFRDNWALGFTPERVVGVWVGNADGAGMTNVSGVSGAAPIWRDVITAAHEGVPVTPFVPPERMARATVCTPTGLQPGEACPAPTLEWFVSGTEPAGAEGYYRRGDDGLAVGAPASVRSWAVEAGWRTSSPGQHEGDRVRIVQPAPGSRLVLAPELRVQEVMLAASVDAGAARVEFRIDGSVVGTTGGDATRIAWTLEPGVHLLEVTAYFNDESVATARSRFEVR